MELILNELTRKQTAHETTERASAELARIITKKPDQEILTKCSKVNQKKGINQKTLSNWVPIIPTGKGTGKQAIDSIASWEDNPFGSCSSGESPDQVPQFYCYSTENPVNKFPKNAKSRFWHENLRRDGSLSQRLTKFSEFGMSSLTLIEVQNWNLSQFFQCLRVSIELKLPQLVCWHRKLPNIQGVNPAQPILPLKFDSRLAFRAVLTHGRLRVLVEDEGCDWRSHF